MKKLLLSLAVAVMGAFATSAATYEIYAGGEETWTATDDGFTTTVTVDGKSFTLTTAKASSTSTLKDPGTTNAIRVFKGSDLTISSTDFEFNNVFLTGEKSNYDQNPTVTEGWTLKTNTSDYTYLLTNATAQKTVTFNATGKQARIHKITVSDEEIVEEPSTVTSVKSVKETIALDTDSKVTVDYELTVGWVNGSNIFACDKAGDFIQLYGSNTVKVGDVIPAGWEATYKFYNDVTPELVDFTLPATTEGTFTPKEVAAADITVAMVNSVVMVKNVVLTEASPATKDNFTGKVGDVELSLRNNYTLASVPAGTYDLTLVVTVYNGEPSLYVASYNSDAVVPTEPVTATTVKSVKETIALASGTAIKVDYSLVVAFVNNSNIFVCDAAGDFIQIYFKNEYKVGDIIPGGWEATYTLYNGVTPEIEKVTTALPAATEGTFTPEVVEASAITAAMVNSVVMVKNVVLAEASPATKDNFTGKVGDVELNLRNNYTLESVPAGTYDITLVVTVYNSEPSLYVTNFTASAGLDSVMVDADAPVEYFNLQGIRVENPENGVFIRRQGTTVTKVVM